MAGEQSRKAELIAQLAQARARLGASSVDVRVGLDVPTRLRHNFSRHLLLWLSGAALVGVVLAKLPSRTRKIYVDPQGRNLGQKKMAQAGLLIAGLKFAFDLARPVVLRVATERLQPLVEQYFANRSRRR